MLISRDFFMMLFICTEEKTLTLNKMENIFIYLKYQITMYSSLSSFFIFCCYTQIAFIVAFNQIEYIMVFSMKMQFNITIFEDQRFSTAFHGGNIIRFTQYFHNIIMRNFKFQCCTIL